MRTFKTFLTILLAFAIFTPATKASVAVSAAESREMIVKKMTENESSASLLMEKMGKTKIGKKALKLAKYLNGGSELDFKSEPDKWLLYGIIGIVAGWVFWYMGWYFFGPVALLGYLLWLAGVCLIGYWALKKFELM